MRVAARRGAGLAVLAALLVACSGDDDSATTAATAAVASGSTVTQATGATDPDATEPDATEAPPTTPPGTLPLLTVPTEPVVPPPRPECAPGPDRTVVDLPDETQAPVLVENIDVPAVDLGEVTIPAVRIPGFVVPAGVLDGGCRIEYAAPGGCLGAIELSSVEIPAVRIAGYRLPAVEVDGEELAPAIEQEEIVLPAATTPAVRVEQTCEVQVDGADRTIVRPTLTRPRVVRPEAVRRAALRPEVCVEDTCADELRIPAGIVPQASLAEVVVPELRAQVAAVPNAPSAEVVETPTGVAFTAPVDVLFDVESAALRPEAAASLQGIATAIAALPPGTPISVEGHTDGDGEPAYNLDLSTRRAQSVADFLVTSSGVAADRITTVGRGEDFPVAPNDTPEGKARNRRVVIAVTTS